MTVVKLESYCKSSTSNVHFGNVKRLLWKLYKQCISCHVSLLENKLLLEWSLLKCLFTGIFLLRYPENLDEVSDCYPFVLFTVWHKLKAVKAKERWLPEQEASHLRGFHNLQQPVRGGAHECCYQCKLLVSPLFQSLIAFKTVWRRAMKTSFSRSIRLNVVLHLKITET